MDTVEVYRMSIDNIRYCCRRTGIFEQKLISTALALTLALADSGTPICYTHWLLFEWI